LAWPTPAEPSLRKTSGKNRTKSISQQREREAVSERVLYNARHACIACWTWAQVIYTLTKRQPVVLSGLALHTCLTAGLCKGFALQLPVQPADLICFYTALAIEGKNLGWDCFPAPEKVKMLRAADRKMLKTKAESKGSGFYKPFFYSL